MKNTQSFNLLKKPWFYLVSVLLVFVITLLCVYVVPHKLSIIVPIQNIEYVALYPGTDDEKRIDDNNLELFIDLLKKAKITIYPKWGKDMRWGYNAEIEVYYKNGKSIKFGEHRWYKNTTYGNFYNNSFDFEAFYKLFS